MLNSFVVQVQDEAYFVWERMVLELDTYSRFASQFWVHILNLKHTFYILGTHGYIFLERVSGTTAFKIHDHNHSHFKLPISQCNVIVGALFLLRVSNCPLLSLGLLDLGYLLALEIVICGTCYILGLTIVL